MKSVISSKYRIMNHSYQARMSKIEYFRFSKLDQHRGRHLNLSKRVSQLEKKEEKKNSVSHFGFFAEKDNILFWYFYKYKNNEILLYRRLIAEQAKKR